MLILGRKPGSSVIINDDIEVIVLATQQGQVKLGIKAPKDVSVHRDEIYARIQAEKQNAEAV